MAVQTCTQPDAWSYCPKYLFHSINHRMVCPIQSVHYRAARLQFLWYFWAGIAAASVTVSPWRGALNACYCWSIWKNQQSWIFVPGSFRCLSLRYLCSSISASLGIAHPTRFEASSCQWVPVCTAARITSKVFFQVCSRFRWRNPNCFGKTEYHK